MLSLKLEKLYFHDGRELIKLNYKGDSNIKGNSSIGMEELLLQVSAICVMWESPFVALEAKRVAP